MRRQAYLITAYKDPEALFRLVSSFDDEDEAYIHIDKKHIDEMEKSPRLNEIRNRPGCHIFSEYSIPWGGYQHVQAMLFLIKKAIEKDRNVYLHMLTGEDMLLTDAGEIRKRFTETEDAGLIYMDWIEEKDFNDSVKRRYLRYNVFKGRNLRNPVIWHLKNLTCGIQKLIGIKRKSFGGFDRIYKGLFYISLPGECAGDITDYLSEHGEYEKDMYSTELPEEFFFHTLLLNESFCEGKWKEKIKRSELRYMDWERGNGSSPAYLEPDDPALDKARGEGRIFARKFHGY